MNSAELARDKFNSLFAAHDAKETGATAQQKKPALKAVKKAATTKVKQQ